ncbi:MAG: hypothetical protein PT943_02950 [Ruminococcus sp.]|nr:hypothetical protein [Ruminococcus sp.]
MEKTSALKSTLTGLAASLLLIPVTTAVCAAATLKSGSAAETAALCAYVCVFVSSFAGAFVAVKRSAAPAAALISSGVVAVLLFLAAVTASDSVSFVPALCALAGGGLAALISGRKKPHAKTHGKPRPRRRK